MKGKSQVGFNIFEPRYKQQFYKIYKIDRYFGYLVIALIEYADNVQMI